VLHTISQFSSIYEEILRDISEQSSSEREQDSVSRFRTKRTSRHQICGLRHFAKNSLARKKDEIQLCHRGMFGSRPCLRIERDFAFPNLLNTCFLAFKCFPLVSSQIVYHFCKFLCASRDCLRAPNKYRFSLFLSLSLSPNFSTGMVGSFHQARDSYRRNADATFPDKRSFTLRRTLLRSAHVRWPDNAPLVDEHDARCGRIGSSRGDTTGYLTSGMRLRDGANSFFQTRSKHTREGVKKKSGRSNRDARDSVTEGKITATRTLRTTHAGSA